MTLLHMITQRAGLSRDPLYTNFSGLAYISTTVYFIGLGETCCKQPHGSGTGILNNISLALKETVHQIRTGKKKYHGMDTSH